MKIPNRRGGGARRLSNGTFHLSGQLLNFVDMTNDKRRCRKTESTKLSPGAAIYKLGSDLLHLSGERISAKTDLSVPCNYHVFERTDVRLRLIYS